MSADVGKAAPDFTLPGTGGQDYTLSSYRGQPVVLVFYPGDNTAVCTTQLKSYTADFDEFEGVDAQILAISLLKTDHGNVETLFKDFEALGRGGEPSEKRRIVDHVIEQLSVHASIEEELLYPALRTKLGADDFPVLEALEEHHAAKLFLS